MSNREKGAWVELLALLLIWGFYFAGLIGAAASGALEAEGFARAMGVRFVACPASRSGRTVQCISCGGRFGLPLCAQADRGFVITFPAHGARAAAAAARCS